MSEGPTPIDRDAIFTREPFHFHQPRASIRVVVTFPDGTQKQTDMELDRHTARFIEPLSRTREIDPRDYRDAVAQSEGRSLLAKHVAAKFLELVESGDAINGYSREQWEAMHREGVTPQDIAETKPPRVGWD